MGISASQGRLLQLTSKMSDLEFQAQQTTNAKIRLAQSTEYITKKYTEELNQKKLVGISGYSSSGPIYTDLDANSFMTFNASSLEAQKMLKTKEGKVLISGDMENKYKAANGDITTFLSGIPSTDTAKTTYYTNLFNEMYKYGYEAESDSNLVDGDWLKNQLEEGNLYLYEFNTEAQNGLGGFDSISWQTGDSGITEADDESKIAEVKAEYEQELSAVQADDKRFDLELKQIETEHTAIQTEYDTIKKLIDKDIEGSFKTFS